MSLPKFHRDLGMSKVHAMSAGEECVGKEGVMNALALDAQLVKMQQMGGVSRSIVWLNEAHEACGLNLWQRVCVWIATWFHRDDSLIRYFANYEKSLKTLAQLDIQVAQLHGHNPALVSHYWNCWKQFQKTFHVQESEYQNFFNQPHPNLIRGTRLQEDINALLLCYAQHYNAEQLVCDYVSQGLLAQALWVLQAKGLALSSFEDKLPKKEYDWLVLQTQFKATSTTPLDFMALNVPGGPVVQSSSITYGAVQHWVEGLTDKVAKLLGFHKPFDALPSQPVGQGISGPHVTSPMDLSSEDSSLQAFLEKSPMGFGWGYKSANLMRLKTLSDEVSRQCSYCHVQVPSFLPIGDMEMSSYIRHAYPQLDQRWSDFLATFSIKDKENFIAKRGGLQLSSEAKDILQDIRSHIEKQFSNPYYSSPQIEQWLRVQQPSFVIVRSTGKEDSDTSSNAGGNASIPFVKPVPEEISRAMGEVLISYFSEKSILQRMAAHDGSLLTEGPFLPVVVQEMIGENVAGIGTPAEEVPRSGVMFTRLPGKAQGLTELYVGLGNNEGIVSSRVSADHYLLDGHRGLAKVIRTKQTRFVAVKRPDGSYGCEPIKNEDMLLAQSSALPDTLAHDMKTIADYFSVRYGSAQTPKPLDMEFTIRMDPHGGKPTIYLLQARPLVMVKKEHEPSYIDAQVLAEVDHVHRVEGKVLLDGGAYVRQVNSSDEILVCDTITEALDSYLKSPTLAKIKSVIIQKPAPGTSHEAVTFRARGVAVMVVEDEYSFENVQHLVGMTDSTASLLLDLQRAIIIKKPESGECTCEGYICYPMPLEYSITPSTMVLNMYKMLNSKGAKDAVLEERVGLSFKKFQSKMDMLIEECSQGHELLKVTGSEGYSLRALLEEMASGDKPQAKLAAATLLNTLRNFTLSHKTQALPRSRLELIAVLESVTDIIEKQLLPATKKPANSLDRLYPIRLLEACLFQSEDGVRGAFSYASCLEAIKNQDRARDVVKGVMGEVADVETALSYIPLFRISHVLLDPTQALVWKAITQHIKIIDYNSFYHVRELVLTLDRLDSLVEWVNVDLADLLHKHGLDHPNQVTPAAVNSLFKDLATQSQAAKTDLNHCTHINQDLKILHEQMGVWEDPEHVKKHVGHLINSFCFMGFNTSIIGGSLKERISSSHPFAKFAFLRTMQAAIRTYDEVVKTCKVSTKYESKVALVSDVKKLLEHYREMMQAVAALAHQYGLFTMLGNTGWGAMKFGDYMGRIDKGGSYYFGFSEKKTTPGFLNINPSSLSEEQGEALLLPSSEFNVASAIVGNELDYKFSVIWPNTLEDYFTFFHQNMEAMLAAVRGKLGFSHTMLPSAIGSYCQQIVGKMGPGAQGKISAIDVQGSLIDVHMDIPLRQHAAKVRVSCDRSKQPLTLRTHVEMFGNPEHSRWELTASAASLIGTDLSGLYTTSPKINFQTPKCVSFEVTTRGASDAQQKAVVDFLQAMCAYSMCSHSHASYIGETIKLRKAFGGGSSLPAFAQDLTQGGFYLGLTVADKALQVGDTMEAARIITHIQDMITAKSWLADLTGDFPSGSGKNIHSTLFVHACDVIKAKSLAKGGV